MEYQILKTASNKPEKIKTSYLHGNSDKYYGQHYHVSQILEDNETTSLTKREESINKNVQLEH